MRPTLQFLVDLHMKFAFYWFTHALCAYIRSLIIKHVKCFVCYGVIALNV
jgi:hypothetical protein